MFHILTPNTRPMRLYDEDQANREILGNSYLPTGKYGSLSCYTRQIPRLREIRSRADNYRVCLISPKPGIQLAPLSQSIFRVPVLHGLFNHFEKTDGTTALLLQRTDHFLGNVAFQWHMMLEFFIPLYLKGLFWAQPYSSRLQIEVSNRLRTDVELPFVGLKISHSAVSVRARHLIPKRVCLVDAE